MNVYIADGWLFDAVFRRTPGGHDVVQLDVVVKDEGSDDDHRVTMWLHDEAMIERNRDFLTKGRIVFVRASVRTEPTVDKHGGIVGEHLVFTVRELRIPHRAKPAAEVAAKPEARRDGVEVAA